MKRFVYYTAGDVVKWIVAGAITSFYMQTNNNIVVIDTVEGRQHKIVSSSEEAPIIIGNLLTAIEPCTGKSDVIDLRKKY